MWELVWNGTVPRHERASQLLFFAVANVMCAINNVDISPEINSGGGPVDFKFSTGYRGRVLVELKLSTGSVVHGYGRSSRSTKRPLRPAPPYSLSWTSVRWGASYGQSRNSKLMLKRGARVRQDSS